MQSRGEIYAWAPPEFDITERSTVSKSIESVRHAWRFPLTSEGEEKYFIAITSNAAFGGWTKIFANPRLCVTIVGRFTSGGNIIDTQHRLLAPRAQPEPAAPPEPPTGGHDSRTSIMLHALH